MTPDQAFWSSLNRPEFRRRLVYLALRNGASTVAEAEDCVQDALVSAVTAAGNVEDPSRADHWLKTIVANAARMHFRAQQRVRRGGGAEHSELHEEAIATWSTPERIASDHETLAALEAALRVDRDGYLLEESLAWEGTLASYAEAHGENVSAVKTRIRRLRGRLRARLDAVEGVAA